MKKLLLITFPYKADAKGNVFPIIPLTLKSGNKKKDFFALVDSGATISIFRAEVADILGIEIEKGEQLYLGGVGGHIKGYLHELPIEVAGKKFICPIVFSREYAVSFSLLGRQGFFRQFKIIFEEKKNLLTLE